jgi:hypothetical protein
MLSNRDRRRFERVTARAMRPGGRRSVATVLGRLSTRTLLVTLTVLAVAIGLGGFYVSRSALEPRAADLAMGGRPGAAPEPLPEPRAARPAQATDAKPADTRPADTRQADTRQADTRQADTRQAKATDARETHLRQLQPVLRTDADRLSQIVRRMRGEAHVPGDLRALFTSHRTLSADLANHHQEYSEAKERLRKSLADQEEEFQQTGQLVATKVALAPVGEARRSEVVGAILEKCLARGPGMTLTTRPDGYQYTVRGRSQRYSGGAAVAEDEGAAFAAFTSFTPEAEVVTRCESMKKRAAAIMASAEKLSADALVLAEQTTLPGDCKYTDAE